jgi:hypothetical protein
MQAAMQIATQAEQLAKNLPPSDKSAGKNFVSPGMNPQDSAEAADSVVGPSAKPAIKE